MSELENLFYEADTRKHQQAVVKWMSKSIDNMLHRMLSHDASKFSDDEAQYYIEPVYRLNTQEVPYGSAEYKTLTNQMGMGWDHHKKVNDHHPEHFGKDDPFSRMNLFNIIEMLCDWIAASERRGNDPTLPLSRMIKDLGMSEQLASVIKNTVNSLVADSTG